MLSSQYILTNTDGFAGVRSLLPNQYTLTYIDNKADDYTREKIWLCLADQSLFAIR